jgi:hypothetical protein
MRSPDNKHSEAGSALQRFQWFAQPADDLASIWYCPPRKKMKLPYLSLFALGLALSTGADASTLAVKGADYSQSCGYFSNQIEKLQIDYYVNGLPAGTVVRLHWGVGGVVNGASSPRPFNWRDGSGRVLEEPAKIAEPELIQVAPGNYQISFSLSIYGRGESQSLGYLQFVIKQEQPTSTQWDKPNSENGFFQVAFTHMGSCVDPQHQTPSMVDLLVTPILR